MELFAFVTSVINKETNFIFNVYIKGKKKFIINLCMFVAICVCNYVYIWARGRVVKTATF